MGKAYNRFCAESLKEPRDEADLFQNDQTFSLFTLVEGRFDVLFAEEQTAELTLRSYLSSSGRSLKTCETESSSGLLYC